MGSDRDEVVAHEKTAVECDEHGVARQQRSLGRNCLRMDVQVRLGGLTGVPNFANEFSTFDVVADADAQAPLSKVCE